MIKDDGFEINVEDGTVRVILKDQNGYVAGEVILKRQFLGEQVGLLVAIPNRDEVFKDNLDGDLILSRQYTNLDKFTIDYGSFQVEYEKENRI